MKKLPSISLRPIARIIAGIAAATTLLAGVPRPASADELLVPMIFGGSVDVINPATGIDQGSLITGLAEPSGVAVAADGSFYVSVEGAYPAPAVNHYSAGGTLLGSLPLASSGATIYSGGGTRIGPDGTVYASDFGAGVLYGFNETTGALAGAPVSGMTAGSGIAFDGAGNIYVADFGVEGEPNTGDVVEYNITTHAQTTFVQPGSGPNASPLLNPDGLLFLPNGNLLVSDLASNDILEYNANGSFDTVFAELTPTPGPPFYSNSPAGMTLTPDRQHVLVAALGYTDPPNVTGELPEYDLSGNLVNTLGGALPAPSDVAYLSDASWNSNGSGNYSGASNWSSGALPSGIGLNVTFGAGTTTPVNVASLTVTIDGQYVAGSLTFNSPTTAYTLQPAGSGSPSITLDNLGAGASVTVASGAAPPTIRSTLILSDAGGTTFNIASGATLNVGPIVAESPLILSGGGKLQINSAPTLATGSNLQINAGTLTFNTGGAATIGAGVTATVAAGAQLELAGTTSALNAAVNITNNSATPTNGGLYVAGQNQVVGAITGSGATVVGSATQAASLTAYEIRQSSLAIGAGSVVTLTPSGSGSAGHPQGPNNVNDSSNVASLSIAGSLNHWTGTLDIGNNGLVIAYGAPANDPFATIENMVESGYNGGNWDGMGITSSLAAAATTSSQPLNIGLEDFTPGVGSFANQSSIVFEGQTIATNAVLVRLTYMDDVVLAGDMLQNDATDDALIFAANYGIGATWSVGDLTHDGTINSDDALLFAANYSTSLPSLDGTTGNAVGLAAVPEPSSLLLLGIACCAAPSILRRRERQI